nr:hypothetical protein CFP56_46754 [Quercus suber]
MSSTHIHTDAADTSRRVGRISGSLSFLVRPDGEWHDARHGCGMDHVLTCPDLICSVLAMEQRQAEGRKCRKQRIVCEFEASTVRSSNPCPSPHAVGGRSRHWLVAARCTRK